MMTIAEFISRHGWSEDDPEYYAIRDYERGYVSPAEAAWFYGADLNAVIGLIAEAEEQHIDLTED